METLFKNAQGLQMRDFLRQYGERIKNKHVLYAVSTNLAEDQQIRRVTRSRGSGMNIKIGKSEGNPYARLLSYTNMGSNYSQQFPQSGIRVLMVRTYPKRKDSETGTSLVNVAETLLKRALRDMNRVVPFRGSEIFRVDPQELFDLIEEIDLAGYDYSERRSSERLGTRLLWLITDSLTGKQSLMFASDYDEVLRKYAEENDLNLMDERSKYITRFYIRPVTRPQDAYLTYSNEEVGVPQRDQTTVQQPSGVGSSPLLNRRRRREEESDAQTPKRYPWEVPQRRERVRPWHDTGDPPPAQRVRPLRLFEVEKRYPWEPKDRTRDWYDDVLVPPPSQRPRTDEELMPPPPPKRKGKDPVVEPPPKRVSGMIPTSGLKRSYGDDPGAGPSKRRET